MIDAQPAPLAFEKKKTLLDVGVEVPLELQPLVRHLLKSLLVDGDMKAVSDTASDLRTHIESVNYDEIITPGDLNDRRTPLLLATSRGERFLIKKKGNIVGILVPPQEAPETALEISSATLRKRGSLFARLDEGESFLLSYRGNILAALLPPKTPQHKRKRHNTHSQPTLYEPQTKKPPTRVV